MWGGKSLQPACMRSCRSTCTAMVRVMLTQNHPAGAPVQSAGEEDGGAVDTVSGGGGGGARAEWQLHPLHADCTLSGACAEPRPCFCRYLVEPPNDPNDPKKQYK